MNWIQNQAFGFVIPMLLGPAVYLLVKALKQSSEWVDRQGPAVKRTLVVAIAILVTAGTNLVGQPIHCDTTALNAADCLGQLTPDILKAILASGTAFLLHALKQSPPSA